MVGDCSTDAASLGLLLGDKDLGGQPGGGERERRGLWTSTGGQVENCNGVGWLWLTSSSPLGVSHDDEPAEVDVDRSSSWVGVGWVGGGVEVGTRIKYSLPLP